MIEVAGRIHAAVGFDACLFLRFSMRSCATCILVALSFAVCACWATCLFYFRIFLNDARLAQGIVPERC